MGMLCDLCAEESTLSGFCKFLDSTDMIVNNVMNIVIDNKTTSFEDDILMQALLS